MSNPVGDVTQPDGAAAARSLSAVDANPAFSREVAMARRDQTKRRLTVIGGQLLVVVLWLGVWQYMSGRVIKTFFSSSPSLIFSRLVEWFRNGSIWTNLLVTLQEFGLGLLIGGVAAVLMGFSLGRLHRLSAILNPFITVVYSMPKLALAPLFILWFGIGLESKVILVALISFFLIFYNTFIGARDVDSGYINALRVMGAKKLDVYRQVVAPAASIWILTGFRLAVPQALIGAVVGELISSNEGIGYVIANAASFFDTTSVLAGVAIVAAVSVALAQMIIWLERVLTRWK